MKPAPIVCASVLLAVSSPAASQTEGVTTEWDIRESLATLKAQMERLEPLIEQINPEEWVAKGAPQGYVDQWKALRAEIGYVARAVTELSARPDTLTKTLESYLRMQAVEEMTRSFLDGVSRYHNPAVADLLTGIMNENADSRQKLRDYLVELTALKETECRVADQEAQRCRQQLVNRP